MNKLFTLTLISLTANSSIICMHKMFTLTKKTSTPEHRAYTTSQDKNLPQENQMAFYMQYNKTSHQSPHNSTKKTTDFFGGNTGTYTKPDSMEFYKKYRSNK
jgi:hypothetical protein